MPADDLRDYLLSTEVVDWRDARVLKQAQSLAGTDPLTTAAQCYAFVRDEIQHSWDFQRDPVTCNASDVLDEATGYCYAKSHLLAGLLRANGLPAGFCYQRLTNDGPGTGYCLHGFNAVYLPDFGWYRIDARGKKEGLDARFEPPVEHLAFAADQEGEFLLPGIYANPLPNVIAALHSYSTWDELADNLPDMHPAAILELIEHQKGRGRA